MRTVSSSPTNAINRFWDKYIKYIADKGVKPSVSRWYVIRAEHYIKYSSEKKLADHGTDDVVVYLEKQGATDKISDWQFRQTVDAIQNLFAMLGVSWLPEVDWQHWMDSSSSLAVTHATIAREMPAEETIKRLAEHTQSELTEVRRLYGDC